MPKSRRDKKVSLTNVIKKGHELKNRCLTQIREYVDNFEHIFIFKYDNMRTEYLQKLREELKPESRFLFGKNKVFQIAFGKNSDNETAVGLNKLGKYLNGRCGILFTNKNKSEIIDWMNSCSCPEFPRGGSKIDSTIVINAGPLTQFNNAIEPYLREIGLPTALDNGTIQLLKDYEICKTGSILTSKQAKMLKFFDYKLAEFKLTPIAVWTRGHGVEKLFKNK